MKKSSGLIWGIAFMIFGIIVLLKALGFFDVGLFFWISLVIIIPCFIGLFGKGKNKWGYIVGICIGLLFMFISFDIIRWSMFGPLCAAGVFLLIGVKLITGKNQNDDNYRGRDDINQQGTGNNGYYGNSNFNPNNSNTGYSFDPGNSNYTGSNANTNNTNSDYAGNGTNTNNTSSDYAGNGINTNNTNSNYAGNSANTNKTNSNSSYSFYSNNSFGCYSNAPNNQGNGYYNANNSYKPDIPESGDPSKKYEVDIEVDYTNNGEYTQSTTDSNSNRTFYSDSYGNTYEGTNAGSGSTRPENDSEYKAYSAVLCGRDINFHNEPFHGAMLSSVLGGIELNLRSAIISKDVNIDVKAVLGGVEIHVPRNAKIVVNCTPILGGLDDKTVAPVGMINCPTIYINATCVLGGVDVNY